MIERRDLGLTEDLSDEVQKNDDNRNGDNVDYLDASDDNNNNANVDMKDINNENALTNNVDINDVGVSSDILVENQEDIYAAQQTSRKKKAKKRASKKKMVIFSIIIALVICIAAGAAFTGIYFTRKNAAPDPVKLNAEFEFNNIEGNLTVYEVVGEDGIKAKITYSSIVGNSYTVTFYDDIDKANAAFTDAKEIVTGLTVVRQRKTAVYVGGITGGTIFMDYI